jgi:collagen type V/XI/XXIV/XXVII alpha
LPGPPSPDGPKGYTGQLGIRGEVGPPGLRGLPGYPGLIGAVGIPGYTGEKGDKGDQGNDGVAGEKGLVGYKGMNGPRGPVGEAGDKGYKGIRGDKGEKGDTGPKGRTGLPGIKGFQGPSGPTGKAGSPGPPGYPGHQGLQGLSGPMGPQGDTGQTGYPGQKGEKGDAPPSSNHFYQSLGSSDVIPSLSDIIDDVMEDDTLRSCIHPLLNYKYLGMSPKQPAKSCFQIFNLYTQSPNGWYWIDPNEGCAQDSLQVFCNFSSSETCIQIFTGSHFEIREKWRENFKITLGDILNNTMNSTSLHVQLNLLKYYNTRVRQSFHFQTASNKELVKTWGNVDNKQITFADYQIITETQSNSSLSYTIEVQSSDDNYSMLPILDISLLHSELHWIWLSPLCFQYRHNIT